MIRPATPEDIPAAVEMGRKFHAVSPWSTFTFDPLKTALALYELQKAGGLLVTDAMTGGIGITVSPVFFADAVTAQEAFWWCESPRDALALLKAGEDYARSQGAAGLSMIRLHGLNERLDDLYTRRGYLPKEHHYYKGF